MSPSPALLHRRVDVGASPEDGLLDRIRFGDRSAFGQFYASVAPAARRHARRYVSPTDADDVVAETVIAVWQAMRRGGGPTHRPIPYVFRSVRTAAWRLQRVQQAERSKALRLADRGVAPDTEDLPFDGALAAAFRSLTPRHRLALWSSVVEGRTAAEVGEQFGISANAAAALTMRARRALRSAYTASAPTAGAARPGID